MFHDKFHAVAGCIEGNPLYRTQLVGVQQSGHGFTFNFDKLIQHARREMIGFHHQGITLPMAT